MRRYQTVVIDHQSDVIVGPFLHRQQALSWIYEQHARYGPTDFDIMDMRAPESGELP